MPPNVRLTLNKQLLQTENWALYAMAGGQKTKFGGQKRWSDKLP